MTDESPEIETVAAEYRNSRYAVIEYTNWRGERSERRISPREIFWGTSQWHPEPQWLLVAVDADKGAIRYFAMKDIHSWRSDDDR